MAGMMPLIAVAVIVARAAAQTPGACDCDTKRPETMSVRQCSLCSEAEKQAPDVRIFFLKDANPRKPNRWLALPRVHGAAKHELADLTPAERTELWTAAIAKAKELWGDEWGVAYNGNKVRTQCHAHVHIGKLLKGVETGSVVVVRGPAEIPSPGDEGLWIHPHGTKLHVHVKEQTTETVLLR